MLIQRAQQIQAIYLLSHYVQFEIEGKTTAFMRYRDLPGLRQVFGEFLLELAAQNQTEWFPQQCGRCGNSCRRPDILVRHQEIFAIQMELGLTQEQFRQNYLDPANTWNEQDGLMRRGPDGACPFLNGDGPGEARCTIHQVRPRSCRELLSNQIYCRKDPGHLLESLSGCWLRPGQVVVKLADGQRHQCALSPELWAHLTGAILDSPELEDRRLPELVESVEGVLADEIRNFVPAKVDASYYGLMQRLHKVLSEASELMQMGEREEVSLEEAWRRYHHLERLVARPREQPARSEAPKTWLPWDALALSEEQLTARFPFQLESALPLEPLQDLRREVLLAVLSTQDELLQEALARPEPECTLCGECCRRYLVEIHSSDIARLSSHLGISTSQFVEQYTEPGHFSWNLKDRVLKKKPCQRYSRNLLDLQVVGQTQDEECVFLDRKEDGLFYCRVHSHKPDVCRGYQANNKLCRKSNHLYNPGRQAESVAWVELRAEEVLVQTRARQARQVDPLRLARSDWEELDGAAARLEEACLKHAPLPGQSGN
ncbi:MAG: YkgJ family cysteine cluster protein [Vulcanimicrobiota bacterium]